MSLPLAVVSGDPIALCESISKIAFESNPARSLSACISPSAPTTFPIMICNINFALAACVGLSPTSQRFAPMTSMNRAPSSYARASPPPRNKSSPFAASRHPPDTGAAKNRTFSPKISRVASPHAPSTVEQSTYVLASPSRVPLAAAYALATSSAARGSASIANVTSHRAATSATASTTSIAPPFARIASASSRSNAARVASALSRDRFHATTRAPARASARDIAAPMMPIPMNPTAAPRAAVDAPRRRMPPKTARKSDEK